MARTIDTLTPLLNRMWKTVEELKKETQITPDLTSPITVDGYMVTPETREFLLAYRKQNRNVKFLPFMFNSSDPQNYMWVYYENEAFPRGVIGYGTWGAVTPDATTKSQYVVASRRIVNDKYNVDKAQYMMVITTKLPIAVSNAASWLAAHTPLEIGKRLGGALRDFQTNLIDAAQQELNSTHRSLFNWPYYSSVPSTLRDMADRMISEMLPVMDAHKELTDPNSIHTKLHSLVTALARQQKARTRCKASWIVNAQVKRDSVVYSGLRVINNVEEGCVFPYPLNADKATHHTWFSEKDVPAWLMGKMAAVDTLDVNQYVMDMGFKLATNIFMLEEVEQDNA